MPSLIFILTHEQVPDVDNNLDYLSSEDGDQVDVPEDNADFMFGYTPQHSSARVLQPSVDHVPELCRLFRENVNPLNKIVHEPTLDLWTAEVIRNPGSIPVKLEAVMFSIYTLAVLSLSDAACQETFNEQRKVLLTRYRFATKSALSRAKVLSTGDFVVLQAFVLHLLAMRNVYNAHTSWTLMGIAQRLAEGMGLHRDGTHLGLSPFETEMRRRLWWMMRMFDSHMAELAGHAKFKPITLDPQMPHRPSKVNDDQIYPEMTTFPAEPDSATDMCFCALQSEFGYFAATHTAGMRRQQGAVASLWDNYTSTDEIAEKDGAIDDLEQLLENRYVRHCDPTQPIQLMTFLLARNAVNNLHFITHHPRRWSGDTELPESERHYVLTLAIRLIESEVAIRANRQFQAFAWYTSSYFPWAQAIHILESLRSEPLLPEADKAWRLIGEAFEYRPELILDKKPVSMALGNLCLKAYHAREVALSQQGVLTMKPPTYITTLRAQRQAALDGHGGARGLDKQPDGDLYSRRLVNQAHPISRTVAWDSSARGLDSADQVLVAENTERSMDAGGQASQTSLTNPSLLTRPGEGLWVPRVDRQEWTPSIPYSLGDPMATVDGDSLFEQGDHMGVDNVQSIDWNQWDRLLRDWSGTF